MSVLSALCLKLMYLLSRSHASGYEIPDTFSFVLTLGQSKLYGNLLSRNFTKNDIIVS